MRVVGAVPVPEALMVAPPLVASLADGDRAAVALKRQGSERDRVL